MLHRYRDRREAGQLLAAELARYHGRSDVVVLALPRGGVAVAEVVAQALGAPLDLMMVRKIGMPGQPELALGAVATGGFRTYNEQIIGYVTPAELEHLARLAQTELERRALAYRGHRPGPAIEDRAVILVDDGLATGASMRAAVAAARARAPAEVVVAVPVGSAQAVAALQRDADAVVCPRTPEPFLGVGVWYRDFRQLGDAEVVAILQRGWAGEGAHPQP